MTSSDAEQKGAPTLLGNGFVVDRSLPYVPRLDLLRFYLNRRLEVLSELDDHGAARGGNERRSAIGCRSSGGFGQYDHR